MAFRHVLKLKLSSVALTSHLQHHLHTVSLNLVCATTPMKAVTCSVPNISYTQKRLYRKKINVSHLEPLNFDYSEDLEKQQELNPSDLVFKYRNIPEIDELPPLVRKLFTVEYASGKERLEHRSAMVQDKVVSLTGPLANYERHVAFLTVKIRNLIPYIVGDRRNKKHKAYLIERIAKRKKILGYIRRLDYDRFLWLLKELKLTYTAPNRYQYYKPHRRAVFKQNIRNEHFAAVREKIQTEKESIEKEKGSFAVKKETVLRGIESEIAELGISNKEVLEMYEKNLERKRAEANKAPPRKQSGWKKLNDYIEQEEMKKEKEKWVF